MILFLPIYYPYGVEPFHGIIIFYKHITTLWWVFIFLITKSLNQQFAKSSNHQIIKSPNHHITKSPNHQIITSSNRYITISPYHHIITSSNHQIITSSHHHIIKSSHHQISKSFSLRPFAKTLALLCVKFYFSLITFYFLLKPHNNRLQLKLFWSMSKVQKSMLKLFQSLSTPKCP